MSRFAHLSRVGRRSLGAVLLLACLVVATSAAVSAQGPSAATEAKIREQLAREGVPEYIVTRELSDPVVFTADGLVIAPDGGGALAYAQGSYSCRDNKVTAERRVGGSTQWKYESKTNFCYDGSKLAHRDPRFSHRSRALNFGWQVSNTSDNESGGVGDKEHWDTVTAHFVRCVPVLGCVFSDGVTIQKWHRGNGSATDRISFH